MLGVLALYIFAQQAQYAQGHGKLAYSLGDFTPDRETAEAIVAWAALHADSAGGQVPYRQWPQGVKGHFVSRHPPLPDGTGPE